MPAADPLVLCARFENLDAVRAAMLALDERTDADGVRLVRWECRKARNLPQVDLELRFDGARQTFSGMAVAYPEFPRFEPGGPL